MDQAGIDMILVGDSVGNTDLVLFIMFFYYRVTQVLYL